MEVIDYIAYKYYHFDFTFMMLLHIIINIKYIIIMIADAIQF